MWSSLTADPSAGVTHNSKAPTIPPLCTTLNFQNLVREKSKQKSKRPAFPSHTVEARLQQRLGKARPLGQRGPYRLNALSGLVVLRQPFREGTFDERGGRAPPREASWHLHPPWRWHTCKRFKATLVCIDPGPPACHWTTGAKQTSKGQRGHGGDLRAQKKAAGFFDGAFAKFAGWHAFLRCVVTVSVAK